jgi:hypothetical protein
VYPERGAIPRVLILIEGGLVQEVLSDTPDVEAAVLGMDIEGADADEIVEVAGHGERLRGAIHTEAVRLAPELIDAAHVSSR